MDKLIQHFPLRTPVYKTAFSYSVVYLARARLRNLFRINGGCGGKHVVIKRLCGRIETNAQVVFSGAGYEMANCLYF